MTTKRVEVLVLPGCPGIDATLARANAAIATSTVAANVEIVCVDSPAEAMRLRFLGSPTVRVDGVDVDPASHTRRDFGLQCRVYSVEGRLEAAPPVDWIAAALDGHEAPTAT